MGATLGRGYPESMSSEWLYDESIAPGVDYALDDSVDLYEQGRAEIGDPAAEARQIVRLLGIQPDWTVIDMGCGSGAFVAEAARHCRRSIGVDPSPKMLAGAQRRVRETGVPNVEMVSGSFLTYRAPDATADAIVTKMAMHHLPDFWKQVALLEMNRTLKSGGRLFISDVIYSFAAADRQREHDAFLERMGKLVGPAFMTNIELDLRREFMTTDWILEGMLDRAGFRVDQVWKPDTFVANYLCSKSENEPRERPARAVIPDVAAFAADWIAAWNAHDLDRILAHYSDDIEFCSSMIKVVLGIASGCLRGKAKVRQYWQAALQKIPDLHFEPIEATASVDSIALYYRAVMNKRAVEVMFFDEHGKVARSVAHYSP
jgi:putative AdoMet-dependent methyltransferase